MDGPSATSDVFVFGSQQGYSSDGATGSGGLNGVLFGDVSVEQEEASYAFSSPLLFHQLADDAHGLGDSTERRESKRTLEDNQNFSAGGDHKRRKKDATESWDTMYSRLVEYRNLYGVSRRKSAINETLSCSIPHVAICVFRRLKNCLVPKRFAQGKDRSKRSRIVIGQVLFSFRKPVTYTDLQPPLRTRTQTRSLERKYGRRTAARSANTTGPAVFLMIFILSVCFYSWVETRKCPDVLMSLHPNYFLTLIQLLLRTQFTLV